MAKLIIEGEVSQLLKIKKAQRSLEARHIVKCSLEEDKDQEGEISPESEILPEEVDQVNEVIEAKEKLEISEKKKGGRPPKKLSNGKYY